MIKIYNNLIGCTFEEIMDNFKPENILHFAKVEIEEKEFDFVLFDKGVFSNNEPSYFFSDSNSESHTFFTKIDDDDILKASMYVIALKNMDAYENEIIGKDNNLTELFDKKEVFDSLRTMSRSMSVSPLGNSPIIYKEDYRLIENHPSLQFTTYLLDHERLQSMFNFVFEARHIAYFKGIKPYKMAFKSHKVVNGVEELEKEGIYIDKALYQSYMDSLNDKDNILLTGPTGAGKSYINFSLLKKNDVEYHLIQCNEDLRYADLFGSLTVKQNSTNKELVPSLGKISIAYREGLPLVLEEFTALNNKCFLALLSMMTHDELALEIDSEQENGEYVKSIIIKRHPDFHIIATANEEKRYNTNPLTPQVKRRFETILPINYLPELQEIELIEFKLKKKDITPEQDVIKTIVSTGNMLRSEKLVVSTATLATWAEKTARYGINDAAKCHFVPQIIFSRNDLEKVNNILSSKLPNFEKVEVAI